MLFSEMPSTDSIGIGGLGLAAVGAAIGMAAAAWGRAKALFTTVSGLAVRRVELPGDQAARFVGVLLGKYRVSANYVRVYETAFHTAVDADFEYRAFPYEVIGRKPLVFWRGWWPMFFFPPAKTGGGPTTADNVGGGPKNTKSEATESTAPPAMLVFLRGTFDLDAISRAFYASQTVREPNATTGRGFFVYRCTSDGDKHEARGFAEAPWYDSPHTKVLPEFRQLIETQDKAATAAALPSLVLSPAMHSLVDDVGQWMKSRRWYVERNIAWKRGFLLFGPPGTGKTAMVRALGHRFHLPVFVYELAGMSDQEFRTKWDYLKSAPCIALLEDFDNVFNGRVNTTADKYGGGGEDESRPGRPMRANHALRFDTLINAIDGIEPLDGVILILTTNEIDKIDPAIGRPVELDDTSTEFVSTRPGRIDRIFRMGAMSAADVAEMVQRFFAADPDGAAAMTEHFASHPHDTTPAQVRERCVQHALALYWERQATPGD